MHKTREFWNFWTKTATFKSQQNLLTITDSTVLLKSEQLDNHVQVSLKQPTSQAWLHIPLSLPAQRRGVGVHPFQSNERGKEATSPSLTWSNTLAGWGLTRFWHLNPQHNPTHILSNVSDLQHLPWSKHGMGGG